MSLSSVSKTHITVFPTQRRADSQKMSIYNIILNEYDDFVRTMVLLDMKTLEETFTSNTVSVLRWNEPWNVTCFSFPARRVKTRYWPSETRFWLNCNASVPYFHHLASFSATYDLWGLTESDPTSIYDPKSKPLACALCDCF